MHTRSTNEGLAEVYGAIKGGETLTTEVVDRRKEEAGFRQGFGGRVPHG